VQQLPMPTAELRAMEDRHAANQFWLLYVGGFALCCVSPICSLCVWGGMAAVFYMKPAAQRGERPLQGTPARAAAATALATCACFLLAMCGFLTALAFCGGDFGRCPQWEKPAWQPPYHTPVAPHSGEVNVTLSGLHCSNGWAKDNNQKYIFAGQTADGRAYYRGATNRDMYIYYDRRCDERDVTVGAWILGRKPDVYADHGLDKAPRVGCWNNALIKSSDFAVPVGPQKWDWVWCGDHGSPGHTLTLDVQMHRRSLIWSSHPAQASGDNATKDVAYAMI